MIAASMLFAVAATIPPQTEVLSQVSAGKMLCANPDVATKTCSSIASYVVGKDQTWIETSEILLPAEQPVTFQLSGVVKIRGSTICGTMSEADLAKGVVRINGSPLSAEQNATAMSKLITKLKPMAGRKACEVLRYEDGRLMKYGQVEQVDINLPGKPVRWISNSDSYKVAPR